MSYPTTKERLIETGLKRRRSVPEAEVAAREAFLAELLPTLSHAPSVTDHHWDRNHPSYDPTCFCGDPSTPAQAASMAASASAVTGYDAPEESPLARAAVNERRRGGRAASPGQRSYIEGLARRLSDESFVALLIEALRPDSKLTWAEASALIDRAKAALSFSVRPNGYAQPCQICGLVVPAKEGHLSNVNGRWVVEHVGSCPEPEAVEAVPEASQDEVDEAAIASVKPSGLDLSALPAGRYAVPGGDTRLKVRIDKPVRGNWAGYIFVRDAAEYGQGRRYGRQGPGPEARYSGEIQAELAAILADPRAAFAAYGLLTNSCGVCGRVLEDALSVELGIGPVCRARLAEQGY